MGTPLHEDLVVLYVDVQTGFLDGMRGDRVRMEARLVRLARLARWLDVPAVVTFERPRAVKGDLPAALRDALPEGTERVPKSTFDAMGESALPALLDEHGRRTVAVAGSETDVCVLLTVEGLLAAGYRVHLLEDCVFTSCARPDAAIARMRAAGAVPTTLKTLAFELTATVDREAWPEAWRERLTDDPALFPEPEDLTPEM